MIHNGFYIHQKNTTASRSLMSKSSIVSLVFILILTGFTTSSNATELSLQQAISRTLEKHPELSIFNYRTQAQQGQVTQANLSPKPEVKLTLEDAFGSGEHSGLDSAQTTLSVSWILEDNIKQQRVKLAATGFDLIDSEKTIKRFDVATQTTRYFLQALYLQEAMKIAQRAISLAEQTVTELEKRIKLGRTPNAELYRAEAELENRKMDLVDLKHEHLSALHQLAAQWGNNQPDFPEVTGEIENITLVKSFDEIRLRLTNNPQFIQYHAKQRIKQAEIKLAQEQQSPQWQFSTGLRRYESSSEYGLVASFSIPLGGNNNNQGNIARANAELLINQAELQAFRTQLESKLFVVFQNYEHSLHINELLAEKIIPKLEKALKETHKIYESGKYSYLDWLNVQNDLLNAQSRLLNSQYKAHLNLLKIERLTGAVNTN